MLPSARRTSLPAPPQALWVWGNLNPKASMSTPSRLFRSATGDHPAPRGDSLSETTRVLMKMDSGAGTMGQVWNALVV